MDTILYWGVLDGIIFWLHEVRAIEFHVCSTKISADCFSDLGMIVSEWESTTNGSLY